VIPIPFRDMIHIKYPNPLDPYFGQAPMRPATRAVSVDNARTDFVDSLLRNDAVPRVVVTTASKVDEEVTDRLERRWFRKFGGSNRGRPAFLQQGMDVKVLGLNLENLQFGDLSGVTESRITMSFGVQPILVGAKVGLDRSTFSNYREAKSAFWEDEGMNLQGLFTGGVRSQLVPEFIGVGRTPITVRYDNSAVLALQEAEKEKWERATTALARGAITINDHHRIVGLEPFSGGDVFLIPAGVTARPTTDLVGDGAVDTEPETPPQLEAASYGARFLAAATVNGNGRKADVEAY
jgi:HK97 family phage portal protein